MSKKQNIAILALGSELSQGFTLNTGSHFLAKEMTALGYNIFAQITLPDESSTFLDIASKLLSLDIEAIIITGGLGPTSDDKTRQLLADLAHVTLEHSEEAENSIKKFFLKHNKPYHKGNSVQAYFPKGACWLENHNGTAPGIQLSINGKVIFAIPGVPSETRSMFEAHLKPYFTSKQKNVFIAKEILFQGIAEPELETILSRLSFNETSWSSLPEKDGIRLRIYGTNETQVQVSFSSTLKELLKTENVNIISTNGDSLVTALVSALKERNETLGTAESCTGGLIASEIVAIPGSSAIFNGGIVSYSNEIKHRILGVPAEILETYGAVSEEVVARMAEGAKRVLGTDWAIATSGVAGPDGGTKEKPVGLVWFAIASAEGTETFSKIFNGKRNEIREKSVLYVMGKLFTKFTQKSTCTFVQ